MILESTTLVYKVNNKTKTNHSFKTNFWEIHYEAHSSVQVKFQINSMKNKQILVISKVSPFFRAT